MNNEEMIAEIKKIKYQLEQVANAIDYDKNPIEYLILAFDWDDKQLNIAHDIFEEFDNIIEPQLQQGIKEPEANWHEMEAKFREQLNISYQGLKTVVNCFFKNHQWTDVCYYYAKADTVMEFHNLIREYEKQ